MAFNQNIAQEYNRNKILTASPAELTLMLYEGAIKFCNIALIAIEKQDYEKANINIKKAENIITEFKVTLNHKYPVAKDFEMYIIIYIHYWLMLILKKTLRYLIGHLMKSGA